MGIYNHADGNYKTVHVFNHVFGDTIEMVISGHLRLTKVAHKKVNGGGNKSTQSSAQPMEVEEEEIHEQKPSTIPSVSGIRGLSNRLICKSQLATLQMLHRSSIMSRLNIHHVSTI